MTLVPHVIPESAAESPTFTKGQDGGLERLEPLANVSEAANYCGGTCWMEGVNKGYKGVNFQQTPQNTWLTQSISLDPFSNSK